MCYNCHRKGHFARDCRSGRNQGKRSYGDNGRSNAPTNESSSQALVAQDGLGGYDWSNDFEIEPVNYALMTISSSSTSSSSDNKVQKCSKQCLESFKILQKNYDSEREKHSRARLEIQGYELALESLESRILVHEKNELAWGEKYEFQNYELKCREIKINNLNLELEKVVKERDELKLKIEKWEESSKNLDELLNSQMSARDKTGLGYGTQLNEMSNNSETDSEISLSVFDVRSSDEENTPANDRSNAPTNESSSQALVAQDGLGGYDWSNDFEIEPVNYALMAISSSSSSSSSDNEVQKCSKQCLESFKTLQKNYDSEREKHSRARLEIQGYELALESLESRILGHEKNELAWGEKYEFQNYELKCREIKINNLNLELEKVVKERDELKLKIEKWEESSKNLDELLNSQMSARDKTGLGYGTQLNEMSNNSETDSEISLSVFDVRSSDEDQQMIGFPKQMGIMLFPLI
ncbi:putative ribonuclease H-like domain-containing protein [Tanacetum coccineum]